jgi:hypothetical protein
MRELVEWNIPSVFGEQLQVRAKEMAVTQVSSLPFESVMIKRMDR